MKFTFGRKFYDPAAGEGGAGGGTEAPVIDFAANEAAFIAHMATKGIEVLPSTEIQKRVDSAVGKTHADWEGAVSGVIGEAKPDGKKGLEWVKESLPTKIAKPVEKVDKVEEPTNPNKVASDATAAELKALRDELDKQKQERIDEQISNKAKTIGLGISSGLSSIIFNPNDAVDDASKRTAAAQLISSGFKAELDDHNNLVFYKGDSVVTDPSTQKPITLDGIIKKDYAWMLVTKKEPLRGGTGTSADTVVKLVDNQEVMVASSMTEIRKFAQEVKKLEVGTAEYTKFVNASARANALDPRSL